MGAENIIPNAVKRDIALIKAKKSGGMATDKDMKKLEKYKTLYPSMFQVTCSCQSGSESCSGTLSKIRMV